MNNMHIMLDLETWGRTPGSDIRSIGAVVFDPLAGRVCDNAITYGVNFDPTGKTNGSFYVACDNPLIDDPTGDDAYIRKYPLTRDPETVDWWSKQSPEAQAAFANPVDLRKALECFTSFVVNAFPHAPTDDDLKQVRLWCNGPHFDEAILAAAFRAVELEIPWHYRSPRDFRTITEAAGMTSADYCNYGEAHNALDDAIAQAMTVCEAYKRLGLQR